jgi:hypothetical protein
MCWQPHQLLLQYHFCIPFSQHNITSNQAPSLPPTFTAGRVLISKRRNLSLLLMYIHLSICASLKALQSCPCHGAIQHSLDAAWFANV